MAVETDTANCELAASSWAALGSTAVVQVVDRAALAQTREIVMRELAAIDLACSRFRSDSELVRVNANAPRPVPVSATLLEAIEVALRACEATDGDVDPALGEALRLVGYDRDYELLDKPDGSENHRPSPTRLRAHRVAGHRTISVNHSHGTVSVGRGVQLDLGATAKALAADRAARAAHRGTGTGTLVNLGGDLAVAGVAPRGGWQVFVTDDHRNGLQAPGQLVRIHSGGLATSSVTTRRWLHEGSVGHHIIDPRTGSPVEAYWRTASVAAASCVDANVAATAALVRGRAALPWLLEAGLPARLVARNGTVSTVSEWPEELDS